MVKVEKHGHLMMLSTLLQLKKRILTNFQLKVFIFMVFSWKDANGAEVDQMIVILNRYLPLFLLFTLVQLIKRKLVTKTECQIHINALFINIRREQIDTLSLELVSLAKVLTILLIGNLEELLYFVQQNEGISTFFNIFKIYIHFINSYQFVLAIYL